MIRDELMKLADEYAQVSVNLECEILQGEFPVNESMKSVDTARANLQTCLENVCKDAESWRAYKSRKESLLVAGFGRNPLRR